MYAVAYDNPIPGYGTKTVGNLRLFDCQPLSEFKLASFNEGKYSEVRKSLINRRLQATLSCAQDYVRNWLSETAMFTCQSIASKQNQPWSNVWQGVTVDMHLCQERAATEESHSPESTFCGKLVLECPCPWRFQSTSIAPAGAALKPCNAALLRVLVPPSHS